MALTCIACGIALVQSLPPGPVKRFEMHPDTIVRYLAVAGGMVLFTMVPGIVTESVWLSGGGQSWPYALRLHYA